MGCAVDNHLVDGKGDPAPGDDTSGDTMDSATTGDACGSASPAWNLATTWSASLDSSGVPWGGVVVGPLEPGGLPAVVVTSVGTGVVAAYAGVDGAELWQQSPANVAQMSIPALGDLDGDGAPEVVVTTDVGILAFHGDGTRYWTADAPRSVKPACGGVGIADLDGDGLPEVYYGRLIVNGQTGEQRAEGRGGWGTSVAGGSPISVAANLRGSIQSLVVGNAAYDADGNTVWSTGDDGYPAVADLDGDGLADIVVARSTAVVRLTADGTEVWSVAKTGGGPPAIADFDGDGTPDIAVPFADSVVVFDADGVQMWRHKTTETFYVTNGVTAYDLDGDGAAELLLSSEDGVEILDGRSGDVLAASARSSPFCAQGPSVADLDGDGASDVVYLGMGEHEVHVRVLHDTDGFRRSGTVWNQDGFSVTNVRADGTIPSAPESNWPTWNSFRAAGCQ